MGFAELLAERKALETAYWRAAADHAAGYKAALEGSFKKAFPRKRFNMDRAREAPDFAAIRDEWTAKGEAVIVAHTPDKDRLEAALAEAAKTEMPPIMAELRLVHVCHASSWRSQGLGVDRYTRNAAQAYVDKATHYGLRAEVRPVGEPSRCAYGIVHQDYGVFADVDETGWALVDYKPDVPLRDWVKGCWKRGVNPRVYNPFLPHGLEEKLGLDHFGNDLPERKAPALVVATCNSEPATAAEDDDGLDVLIEGDELTDPAPIAS